MDAEFCLVDVFSDQPFGGNQLAVFPRAEGPSGPVMQQLARPFLAGPTALPPTGLETSRRHGKRPLVVAGLVPLE